jgi:GNAT superfamily N-acetyltransferase
MNILIRPAQTEDVTRLAELLTDLFTIEADFVPDAEKQKRGLSMLVIDQSGTAAVFVAETDGYIIGMASVQTLVSTAEGAKVGLVEDVIVDQRFRGQGVGTVLLDHLADWSRSRTFTRLQLLVDKNNQAAVDFYHHHGWQGTSLNCMRLMLR